MYLLHFYRNVNIQSFLSTFFLHLVPGKKSDRAQKVNNYISGLIEDGFSLLQDQKTLLTNNVREDLNQRISVLLCVLPTNPAPQTDS